MACTSEHHNPGVAARLDGWQRRHAALGLPLAVIYKFVDDQGTYLAALITYYALLSLFPLFLVFASVLGFVVDGNHHLQQQLLGSELARFPIVGQQIQDNITEYTGSGAAVSIGILGAVLGGLGVAQAGQNAMNVIWAVPRRRRPNPIRSRLRSLLALTVLGTGVLASTGLAALAAGGGAYGLDLHVVGRWGAFLVGMALNVALFIGAYRLLTARAVALRDVAVGAVVAAVLWQALQSVGTYYLAHKLRGAQEVYGVFGLVLGLMAWIFVESLIVVLCAELNVVRTRRLYPRSLLTPFVDDVDLTPADKAAYGSYARAQQFKQREKIAVTFRPEEPAGPAPADPVPPPPAEPPPPSDLAAGGLEPAARSRTSGLP